MVVLALYSSTEVSVAEEGRAKNNHVGVLSRCCCCAAAAAAEQETHFIMHENEGSHIKSSKHDEQSA